MRAFAFLLLVLVSAIPSLPQAGPEKAKASKVVSPEVQADGHVVFRLWAPNAAHVTLSGDFLPPQGIGVELTRSNDEIWTWRSEPLASGLYSYSYNLDGVPLPDPAAHLTKPGLEQTESAFFVPGAAASLLQVADVPHGEVRTVFYRSSIAGRTASMHIYLPPGYGAGTALYPVVFLLHGGGDDDSTWVSVGRLNQNKVTKADHSENLPNGEHAWWFLPAPIMLYSVVETIACRSLSG